MAKIGDKIRQIRKEKNLTLNELANLTGLSQGFLSQVERSKSSVTLQSLSKISDALNVSRSYFFEDSDVSSLNNNEISTTTNINASHDINFFYKSLIGDLNAPIIQPMLAVLLSEEKRPIQSHHSGEEFGYVLEGELTLLIDDEEKKLKQGDSFHISSQKPHTWFNDTDKVVKMLYIHTNID